jgi:hypothetical protein
MMGSLSIRTTRETLSSMSNDHSLDLEVEYLHWLLAEQSPAPHAFCDQHSGGESFYPAGDQNSLF